MKLLQTRYSYKCEFCGGASRQFILLKYCAHMASFHICKSKYVKLYALEFYEDYAKPVERELMEAK